MSELSPPRGAEDIEILDGEGKELFPANDIARALWLPHLLTPELEKPSTTVLEHEHSISLAGKAIERTYRRVNNLELHDRHWLPIQIETSRAVTRGLEVAEGYQAIPFEDLKKAMDDLAPAEIAHYRTIAEANEDATPEDFNRAGHLEKPSRIARILGTAPRLYDNTPENLETLRHIRHSFNSLLLLEGYRHAAGTLDLCLAFGERKHVDAAVNLAARLRNLTCDPILNNPRQRITQQLEASGSIADLANALSYNHVDDNIRGYIQNRIDQLRRRAWIRITEDRTIGLMLQARETQLNGGWPTEKPATQTNETPGEPTPLPKPEKKSVSQPKPDFLAQYTRELQSLASSTDFKQFELLATKELKRRGLDEAREVLVKGENDLDGNVIVGGRSKMEARRYVSSIEFLYSFIPVSGDIAQAKEQLKQASSDCDNFTEQLNELTDRAEDVLTSKQLAKLKDGAPDIQNLSELAAYIRDDWKTASFVIENYWPNGLRTAEQLRQLLFLTKEEIQEIAEQQANIEAQPEPEAEAEPDAPIELRPDVEIIINKIETQNALEAIAAQLDEVILPSKATHEDVKRVVEESGLTEEQAAEIDWDRLFNLVTLRELTDGTMYRSRQGDLGNAPPYFVVVTDFQNTTYAVAESPVEGNATYVISEHECPGTWLEVLQLDKASARELGARRVIHREGRAPKGHLSKIQDVLIDLATTQLKEAS